MSGQQGYRVVGEDIPWQLCVGNVLVCPRCAWGKGLRAMHAYSSFVFFAVQSYPGYPNTFGQRGFTGCSDE